jgi:hypothetical protein
MTMPSYQRSGEPRIEPDDAIIIAPTESRILRVVELERVIVVTPEWRSIEVSNDSR